MRVYVVKLVHVVAWEPGCEAEFKDNVAIFATEEDAEAFIKARKNYLRGVDLVIDYFDVIQSGDPCICDPNEVEDDRKLFWWLYDGEKED